MEFALLTSASQRTVSDLVSLMEYIYSLSSWFPQRLPSLPYLQWLD